MVRVMIRPWSRWADRASAVITAWARSIPAASTATATNL